MPGPFVWLGALVLELVRSFWAVVIGWARWCETRGLMIVRKFLSARFYQLGDR